jgi:hypothetical protein
MAGGYDISFLCLKTAEILKTELLVATKLLLHYLISCKDMGQELWSARLNSLLLGRPCNDHVACRLGRASVHASEKIQQAIAREIQCKGRSADAKQPKASGSRTRLRVRRPWSFPPGLAPHGPSRVDVPGRAVSTDVAFLQHTGETLNWEMYDM